ncbi:MAG TPA: hypothetical protein VGO43_10235 [Pyrinomonadaceae bacterium]|jgi:hypothetical protein|nr:hypothetical protein [Pyrinomonadaceae bacterium]
MKTLSIQFRLLTIVMVLAGAFTASAQPRVYTARDTDVRALFTRIETRTNSFKAAAERSLDRSVWNGTNREDSMNQVIANFETSTDRLTTNFNSRRSTAADVQDVLNKAVLVDRLVRNNRLSTAATSDWSLIRTDLDTLAGYYSIRSDWNSGYGTGTGVIVTPAGRGWGNNPYTANDRDMRTLVNRLRFRSTSFKQGFDRWNSRRTGVFSGVNNSNEIATSVAELDAALNAYGGAYTGTTGRDLDSILRPASAIDAYMKANRANADLTSRWGLIRTDINTLTGYYGMNNWDWQTPRWDNDTRGGGGWNNGGGRGGRGFDAMITGTYRLNTSRSDVVSDVIDRTLGTSYDATQRDRQHRFLERRLASPDMIVIEKRGNDITMASSNAPQVTLNADGTKRTETSPNGRSVTTSVTSAGRDITINYEGDRANDFYVSFTPAGQGLTVVRRVYLEGQNQQVTVTSFYDKTDEAARWDSITYTNNGGGYNGGVVNNGGTFVIPNNTSLIATLDTPLSTRTVRDGDAFQMTVNSPGQYSGAIIRGTASGTRSGSVTGRANMSLNFDTIQLRNGQTYKFAGIVDGVRTAGGETVSVNNEGVVRDNSQTNKTVTRTGIGAALGAIIGAIAGGGSGAAIGAAVGAGAGAGSVVLQGRDNLELATGTEFRITATAPASVDTP